MGHCWQIAKAMQQSTLPLQPTNPLRGMSTLAKQIAMPHEYAPERFPSFPALERTAVMGFNAPFTANLASGGTTKFILSRQASYPMWGETDLYGTTAPGYYGSWQYSSTSGVIDYFSIAGAMIRWNNGNTLATNLAPGIAGSTSLLPYPVFAYDSSFGSAPFVWCPVSASGTGYVGAVIHTTIAAAIPSGVLTLRVWDSPGESRQLEIPFVASGGNLGTWMNAIFTKSCWVQPVAVALSTAINLGTSGPLVVSVFPAPKNFAYAGSATTAGTITLTALSGNLMMPLCVSPEFANSAMPWYSTRTTATAALFTNVTQVLNKSGTVLAGRVAPHVVDPFSVTSTYISGLHPAEKAYLPLETGLYTYVPPSTDMVRFDDYTIDTSLGAYACPVYRLDNDSLVNVMFFSSPSVAEGLAINVDWHVEFRTSSTLFQIGLSAITLEAFHMAQLSLVSAGFFFENPTHKEVLGRVASAVAKMGKAALTAAVASDPRAKAVTSGLQAAKAIILSSHPKPSVVSTSAAASGITKKANPPKPKAKAGKKKGKKGK